MRVFFTNLGCKLNQAELESLSRRFVAAGHSVASSLETADLHVVNSCTVTHMAARDSRKIARRGRRVNAGVRTVLTGCYASEKPEEAAGLEGVDLVVTNDRKEHLLELVHQHFPAEAPSANEIGPSAMGVLPLPYFPLSFGHTRAAVKVEDGCNMRCSFCIIPFTRGAQRSRPLPEVVAEVDALSRAGAREVVVTGVQISHYKWGDAGLFELVSAILEETAVPRLRMTSIAPWKFDLRLLDLFSDPRADKRLCRHIHLSLQSGSTATLRRMRRPYTAERYGSLVDRLRQAVPGMAVTTDVIVGFPGETEEELAESLAFVDKTAFARTHVFPYSVREGTAAAEMPEQVPHETKRTRMKSMLELAADLERRFWRRHLGETARVLWEERRRDRWHGLTDNYLRVVSDSKEDLGNRITETELVEVVDGGLWGRVKNTVETIPSSLMGEG